MDSVQQVGNPDWTTLVIARDYEQFRLWCVRSGRNPRNKKYHFVSGPEQLYGWGRVNVVTLEYPDWWMLEDMQQIALIIERSVG